MKIKWVGCASKQGILKLRLLIFHKFWNLVSFTKKVSHRKMEWKKPKIDFLTGTVIQKTFRYFICKIWTIISNILKFQKHTAFRHLTTDVSKTLKRVGYCLKDDVLEKIHIFPFTREKKINVNIKWGYSSNSILHKIVWALNWLKS
jgi:hypothetical protein